MVGETAIVSVRMRIFILALGVGFFSNLQAQCIESKTILCYAADLKSVDLGVYWKDEAGVPFKNIGALKNRLEARGERLLFACNGGMFKKDFSPQGLLVENGKELSPLDTASGEGNFYLKPNGVFILTTDNQAEVLPTEKFPDRNTIRFATQSGPMLLIQGRINSAFAKNSVNYNIRNGVCVAPNGNVVLAISKTKVNFYEFAEYFQSVGCQDALYLDGFISKAFWPEKNWGQLGGELGPIIGVTAKKSLGGFGEGH